jgi:hypothetical protein
LKVVALKTDKGSYIGHQSDEMEDVQFLQLTNQAALCLPR